MKQNLNHVFILEATKFISREVVLKLQPPCLKIQYSLKQTFVSGKENIQLYTAHKILAFLQNRHY